MTRQEFRQKWEARRDEWTRLGISALVGPLLAELLADLDSVARDEGAELLNLTQAALRSGFSPDTLGKLVRQGNAGQHGPQERPSGPGGRPAPEGVAPCLPHIPCSGCFPAIGAGVTQDAKRRQVMPRARKQDQWTFICGEKGINRIRVYVHRSGTLFVEYRRGGQKVREALGHRDRERAKEEAEELSISLRKPDRKIAVSLNQLFDNYLRDVTPTKSLTTQKHDKTTLDRFRQMLDGRRAADNLTYQDAARYERERRSGGDLRPRGKNKNDKDDKPKRHPLKSRSIVYDFRLLRAVLNWGVGARLIDRNPLTGYKVSELETPKRPVFTDSQYRALLAVANEFPWQFGCLLLLAHETGHRLSAVLHLQWRDVDLAGSRITWRAENDKIGYEHVTPMTVGARNALEDARRIAPGIGDAPVVPG